MGWCRNVDGAVGTPTEAGTREVLRNQGSTMWLCEVVSRGLGRKVGGVSILPPLVAPPPLRTQQHLAKPWVFVFLPSEYLNI